MLAQETNADTKLISDYQVIKVGCEEVLDSNQEYSSMGFVETLIYFIRRTMWKLFHQNASKEIIRELDNLHLSLFRYKSEMINNRAKIKSSTKTQSVASSENILVKYLLANLSGKPIEGLSEDDELEIKQEIERVSNETLSRRTQGIVSKIANSLKVVETKDEYLIEIISRL